MTKFALPVSTTQAIVGAIIGWNLFSGSATDTDALAKILISWVAGPALAAGFAIVLFKLVTAVLRRTRLHLLRVDAYTRVGLILAGAFGAYSLGANNIANVMGVFVTASPFTDFSLGGLVTATSTQQLFLLGAIAIAVGVFTYSKKVLHTVGAGLLTMSPIAAWVVVMSHSLVLFLFASQGLEHFLASHGLPTIPLVPVSSSEVVIGAVIGIGILKGGRGIRWPILGRIGLGWVFTPVIAGVVCFVGLFFLQNVFDQTVYRPVPYVLSEPALARLERAGVDTRPLRDLAGTRFESAATLKNVLDRRRGLTGAVRDAVIAYAVADETAIDPGRLGAIDSGWLSAEQVATVRALEGRRFAHPWMLAETLALRSVAWRMRPATPANRAHNRALENKLAFLYRTFRARR
jgi:PiT family inorganic phosphate transporter